MEHPYTATYSMVSRFNAEPVFWGTKSISAIDEFEAKSIADKWKEIFNMIEDAIWPNKRICVSISLTSISDQATKRTVWPSGFVV